MLAEVVAAVGVDRAHAPDREAGRGRASPEAVTTSRAALAVDDQGAPVRARPSKPTYGRRTTRRSSSVTGQPGATTASSPRARRGDRAHDGAEAGQRRGAGRRRQRGQRGGGGSPGRDSPPRDRRLPGSPRGNHPAGDQDAGAAQQADGHAPAPGRAGPRLPARATGPPGCGRRPVPGPATRRPGRAPRHRPGRRRGSARAPRAPGRSRGRASRAGGRRGRRSPGADVEGNWGRVPAARVRRPRVAVDGHGQRRRDPGDGPQGDRARRGGGRGAATTIVSRQAAVPAPRCAPGVKRGARPRSPRSPRRARRRRRRRRRGAGGPEAAPARAAKATSAMEKRRPHGRQWLPVAVAGLLVFASRRRAGDRLLPRPRAALHDVVVGGDVGDPVVCPVCGRRWPRRRRRPGRRCPSVRLPSRRVSL